MTYCSMCMQRYAARLKVCALFTDYESDLLFWLDTKQQVVVSSDLNGQKRSVLLTSSHFLRHAVAISVFEVTLHVIGYQQLQQPHQAVWAS